MSNPKLLVLKLCGTIKFRRLHGRTVQLDEINVNIFFKFWKYLGKSCRILD